MCNLVKLVTDIGDFISEQPHYLSLYSALGCALQEHDDKAAYDFHVIHPVTLGWGTAEVLA